MTAKLSRAELEAKLAIYESKLPEAPALRLLAVREAQNEERGAEIARLRVELDRVKAELLSHQQIDLPRLRMDLELSNERCRTLQADLNRAHQSLHDALNQPRPEEEARKLESLIQAERAKLEPGGSGAAEPSPGGIRLSASPGLPSGSPGSSE